MWRMGCKKESRQTYSETTLVVQARDNGGLSGAPKEISFKDLDLLLVEMSGEGKGEIKCASQVLDLSKWIELHRWVKLKEGKIEQEEQTREFHFGRVKFEMTVTYLPSVNTFLREGRPQYKW